MMKFLHPRNWSVYSRKLSGDKEALRKYKRIILLSQFTLFGSVIGVFHSLEDLLDGMVFMPVMDMVMSLGIFTCYILNERGRYQLAKFSLLTFLNLFFFVYASLAPPELGVYLYYFPWVALAALVFEDFETRPRLFFISLSLLLLVILFATDFNLFGTFKFEAVDLERSFVINLVSSIIVLVLFIIFMSSINEQSERKLLDLAEEIRVKNAGLQKVNRELDRFFYTTTHDLQIPLKDMKGVIHSAMAEVKDEHVLEYFVLLRDRAQHMESFLSDLIDYSRNSHTGVRNEPVDIALLLDEVINNFGFVNDADRIRFEKDILLDQPVEVDRVRLLIILNNIISNAIKYQRPHIPDPWIKIGAHCFEEQLTIYVADNGQGIPEELLPSIFNMFFRGSTHSKGSGLGLYIVKETIEKMNGTIQVKSTPGTGTHFTIALPVKQTDVPDKNHAASAIQREMK